MAITVFLAGVTSTVDSFIADATVEVTQNFNNEVASFPVGSKRVADHVFKKDPTLTIKGVVSNHPVFEYDSNIIGYDDDRAINADRLLRELWDTGNTFSILTEYNDFNNCILKSYSATFTSASSEALEFTITAQIVRTTSTSTVTGVLAEFLETDSDTSNNGAGQLLDDNTLRLPIAAKQLKENISLNQLNLLRSIGQLDPDEYDKAVSSLYEE